MKVKDLMCSNLIVCDINSSLDKIANVMKKYDVGFIPITNKNKIVGVLTDRDIITRIIANSDNKIEGYLTTSLITIKSDEEINKALILMTKHKIKRLLVIEDDKLVGIISLSDLLNSKLNLINNIKEIFAINRYDDFYETKINEFEL